MMQYDITKMAEEIYEGIYPVNPTYQEILRFHKMLDDAEIPHTLERLYDGWKIAIHGRDGVQISDVIEHYGSYGSEKDLMEMMGLVNGSDVQGYMTAEDVFAAWSEYYQSRERDK